MKSIIIYFLVYPDGDIDKVQVVDLKLEDEYKRSEYSNVNDLSFYDEEEAVAHAKNFAKINNKIYIPFVSTSDN